MKSTLPETRIARLDVARVDIGKLNAGRSPSDALFWNRLGSTSAAALCDCGTCR
jgi:hypothetical protein